MAYVDTSVIQGFQPVELPDQGNMILKALQIQSARGQNRLQDLQIGKEQQTADETNALRRYLNDPANSTLDPASMRAGVSRVAPIAGQSYLKGLLDTQKTQGDIDTSATNLGLKKRDAVDQAVGSLSALGPNVTHQDVFGAVRGLVNSKILTMSEAQADLADMPQDPSQLPAWLAKSQQRGLTPQQQITRNDPTLLQTDGGIVAAKKDGSGGSYLYPSGGAPGAAANQPLQSINQPYVGRQPAGNFAGDPAAILAGLQRIQDPNDRAAALRALQNQLAGANPTPDASGVFQGGGAQGPVSLGGGSGVPQPDRGNGISQIGAQGIPLGAKRVEIEYRTNPLTGETMQLPKYVQPGQTVSPGVVQAPSLRSGLGGIAGLSEAALNDAATRLAHGDSTVLQNYGRGMQGGAQLIAIRNRAAEIAQSEGRSADDQTAAGVALGGEKAGARTLGTRSANLGVAANELDKFSDLALSASNAVPRTQFVPLNRLTQMISSGTGSAQQAAFGAANESVINAFAQVAGRGTPTVAGMEHARAMLNTAQTPEQYIAVIKQLKAEAAAALDSTSEMQGQQRGRLTGNRGTSSAPPSSNGWSIEKVN